ncbi:Bro-N domain-containing protein [Eubacteriales bacterium OttesenSCG-928-K08]|nr:Bro-N domain-containing protein [Eubacteriales bacterium OttesenSCG-928-K08]
MNKLQVFNNSQFGEVRVIEKNGEPWFVAADVCRALEHSNVTMAVTGLEEDERAKFNLGRQGETNIVNEPGLYALVLGSRKPEAKAFKRWITHDVIPAIRKTGQYSVPQPTDLSVKRMEVQERNSRVREGRLLLQIANHKALSEEARELILLNTHEFITGKTLPFRPTLTEPLMTTGDVAKRLGEDIGANLGIHNLYFTENWVGRTANAFGVKIEKYGQVVLDKKKHSDGQVDTFRYNAAGYGRLKEILTNTDNWPQNMRKKYKIA